VCSSTKTAYRMLRRPVLVHSIRLRNGTAMEPSASDDQTAVDDFFGDQGDEGFESQKQQREWEALRRPHVSSGIREGAESARDAHLQRGFDEGFAAGAKVASEPGFL